MSSSGHLSSFEHQYGHTTMQNQDDHGFSSSSSYYVCQNCSRTFPTESAVDDHLRLDKCSVTVLGNYNPHVTENKTAFAEDKVNVSKIKNMYECTHCKILCPTMNDLASHMTNHDEKVVVVQNSGKEHLTRIAFSCPICKKDFRSKGNLAKHQVTHTGIKPYKCSFCDKQFSMKGNKDKHELIHTNTRNFRCEICWKEFTLKGNLQQHVLTHSSVKNFKCSICSKEFTLKGNLEKHVKRHQAGVIRNGKSTVKKSKHKNPYESYKIAIIQPGGVSANPTCTIILKDAAVPLKQCELPEKNVGENSDKGVTVNMSVVPQANISLGLQNVNTSVINTCSSTVHTIEHVNDALVNMCCEKRPVQIHSENNQREYDTYVQNL
ncbi:hypothetical protein ACF0H5_022957 [Mactra antiquata]